MLKRVKFLRRIKVYQEEERPIIYIDEMWTDSNLTFNKCWQSKDTDGIFKTRNASSRVIVLCAGDAMGFFFARYQSHLQSKYQYQRLS